MFIEILFHFINIKKYIFNICQNIYQ